MKKTAALIAVIFLLCFSVFAEDSVRTFFPSLASDPVYPIDSTIGQLVSNDRTENHILLNNALSQAFDFNWTEAFLDNIAKKNLSNLYSGLLSSLLPARNYYFSRAITNADNSVSISVKFAQTNDIITFVLLNNHILNINSSKK